MSDEPKAVRVRIAVAVDHEGNWAAAGKSGHTDMDNREMVFRDDLQEGEASVWIEADVPIPEAQAIEGRMGP